MESTKYTKSNIIAQKSSVQDKEKKLKQIEEEEDEKPQKVSPWIQAWSDNVAGLHSLSELISLCDINVDGDYNLIVADLFDYKKNNIKLAKAQSRKIKVYKGTHMVQEFEVEDRPVAMLTVFDTINKPHLPVIAVSVNSGIVYFKDFAPYLKFDLPLISFTKEESAIWQDLIKISKQRLNDNEDNTIDSQDDADINNLPSLLEKLQEMRETEGIKLSYMSCRLLAIENGDD